MSNPIWRVLPVAALAGSLLLTGCTPSTAEQTPPGSAEEASEAEAPETEAPAPSEGSGNLPDWAAGSVGVGELIGSAKTASWKIDAFQVGTGVTSDDSMFVDPDTNENVLPAGSEVVFVNFEYTNTSAKPINVGLSFATPDLRSVNWKWSTGQPGEHKSDAFVAHGVTTELVKLEATKDTQVFSVEPGQTIARAVSIGYEPGVAAQARSLRLTPIDAEGNLLHDLAEETEVQVAIK